MIPNINELFDKLSDVLTSVTETQTAQTQVVQDEYGLCKVKAYKTYDEETNDEEIIIKVLFKDLEE